MPLYSKTPPSQQIQNEKVSLTNLVCCSNACLGAPTFTTTYLILFPQLFPVFLEILLSVSYTSMICNSICKCALSVTSVGGETTLKSCSNSSHLTTRNPMVAFTVIWWTTQWLLSNLSAIALFTVSGKEIYICLYSLWAFSNHIRRVANHNSVKIKVIWKDWVR